MCWIPLRKKDERMHIAFRNIHTYKIAVNVENVDIDNTENNLDLIENLLECHHIEEPGLYSYFKDHRYHLNVLNKCKITKYKCDNRLCEIDKGFHSYSMKNPIIMYHNNEYFVFPQNKKQHIQGYPKVSYGELVKLECIIPFGAKYYKNSDGEYVSNKIIVKGYEKIKTFK